MKEVKIETGDTYQNHGKDNETKTTEIKNKFYEGIW